MLNEHLLDKDNQMKKSRAKYTAILTVLKKEIIMLKTIAN